MTPKYLLIGLVTGSLFIYVFATIVVGQRTETVLAHLDSEIQLQTNKIVATASLLSRGAANDEISTAFPDCQNVDSLAYDSLLSDLDKGLSRGQLQSLQLVFSRCGDIASSKRSAMSIILDQQVVNLNQLVQVRRDFSNDKAVEWSETWSTLSEIEKEISFLFRNLVTNQGQIIDILAGGGSYDSEKVEEVRLNAEVVRTKLTQATEKASELRKKVM